MEIYFTRHARQRLKLYQVDKQDIVSSLENIEADKLPAGERKEFVSYDFVDKYRFPLKIIFVNERRRVIVITVFRLDSETRYEDIIR